SDTCQAGACLGANPVVCTAADQCHTAGTCNPASGVCSNPAKPNGTSCNDANACTQSDTCQAGACVGANPVVCTAADQCHTAGTCDPATGTCSNPAKPNGARCDDGNACTRTDTCAAATCVGADPVVCTASDQCHTAGTCDPATGTCSNPARPDGARCDDGNGCTQTDTCQGAICVGSQPVVCTALDQCHTAGTCDPATGTCSNPTRQDGTSCDDGDGCTVGDRCIGGTYTGIPRPCDDGVPCTDDSCIAGECRHEPLDSRLAATCSHAPVANKAACDPVRPVYERALALAADARDLSALITGALGAVATDTSGPPGDSLAADVAEVASTLERVARILAGRGDAPAATVWALTLAIHPGVTAPSDFQNPALDRARSALAPLRSP